MVTENYVTHFKVSWWFTVYIQTICFLCNTAEHIGVLIEPNYNKISHWFKKSVSVITVKK